MRLNPIRSTESGPPAEGTDPEFFVLSGGDVGKAVAERLSAEGYTAGFVDGSHDSGELPGEQGDPADIRTLKEAGVSGASTVVVADQFVRRNLLIAQLVRTHFDIPRILVLANTPERSELLADAGHEPVCVATALCDTVVGNL